MDTWQAKLLVILAMFLIAFVSGILPIKLVDLLRSRPPGSAGRRGSRRSGSGGGGGGNTKSVSTSGHEAVRYTAVRADDDDDDDIACREKGIDFEMQTAVKGCTVAACNEEALYSGCLKISNVLN